VAVVVFFGFDLGLGERFVEWLRNLGRKH
jgi:hypothetical protein